MCLAVEQERMGRTAKLLLVCWESWYYGATPNGAAIKRAERKVPTSDVGIARSQLAGQACYPTTAPDMVPVL
jgi:hypothetical protein